MMDGRLGVVTGERENYERERGDENERGGEVIREAKGME